MYVDRFTIANVQEDFTDNAVGDNIFFATIDLILRYEPEKRAGLVRRNLIASWMQDICSNTKITTCYKSSISCDLMYFKDLWLYCFDTEIIYCFIS